ncbi:GLPGLI family protein [Chryseobacterium piperi]|uniref:GLPGLI family protein n=1 Tax=Chryseobacterium piperi TaxID=558152 RepID=UPI0021CD878A|nr:GLPGLI family protein [Chryseobacterium piperi]
MRFTYHYRFVTDTLKKNIISDEIVILDFNEKEKQSIFTGLKHIISDSTMRAKSDKGIMSFPDTSMKIKYVVEKNSNGRIYFYTPNHMPNPVLKVKDERKINWKISNEKESILGYIAQKATTIFAGRQWTAWFNAEIPISDGPYKFYGLPGLILKIYDRTNTHSFEIISVQKKKSDYVVLNDVTYKEAKQITLNEYESISRESPLERYRNKAFSGDIIFHNNEEKQKFLKDLDVQIKESKIHDNNPIELLYK